LPKSAGARHYRPKIPRVPGTLGTHANSSPEACSYGSTDRAPYNLIASVFSIIITVVILECNADANSRFSENTCGNYWQVDC
jgi:hypothetical protein